MASQSLPHPQELKSFGHAVAGHAGTMCDEDGKLFIKPCVQAEIDFYQEVESNYPNFADIIPVFMGTLLLTDPSDTRIGDSIAGVISDAGNVTTDPGQIAAAVSEQIIKASGPTPADADGKPAEWIPTGGGKIKTDTAVVLENAAHGFVKPNIMDLKLGVRLWADDAPEKKRIKFIKTSEETTHRDHGFRIAGMRVYKGSEDDSKLNEDDYMVYDRDYGRNMVNTENLVSEMAKFVFNERAGIDQDLGEAVCRAFVSSIENIEEVLGAHSTRMYSASLLLMFEGDGPALRKAIEANNAAMDAIEDRANTTKKKGTAKGLNVVDDGEEDEDDDDDDELAEMIEGLPPAFSVKLIDFAHAEFVKDAGPDENTLKGIRGAKEVFLKLAGGV